MTALYQQYIRMCRMNWDSQPLKITEMMCFECLAESVSWAVQKLNLWPTAVYPEDDLALVVLGIL